MQKFLVKVDKTPTCWIWNGCTTGGYGRFRNEGKVHNAHKFSYELHNGLVPAGMRVKHKCGNKACVNPEHLLVTFS